MHPPTLLRALSGPLNSLSFSLCVVCIVLACMCFLLTSRQTVFVALGPRAPALVSPHFMIEYSIQTPLSPHWPRRLWKRWLLSQPHMGRQQGKGLLLAAAVPWRNSSPAGLGFDLW